jgi:integrase
MKEPKTPKSKRQIVIPSLALTALEAHQEQQEVRRKEQGNTWKNNDLVFPSPDGSPWSPSLFSRMFSFHARHLGISCRLHDLRHSHATQLLSAGVHPKIVSERLGHSTVAFTLDTYTHAVQGMDRDAAARIGDNLQAALSEAEKASKEKPKRHLSVVSL